MPQVGHFKSRRWWISISFGGEQLFADPRGCAPDIPVQRVTSHESEAREPTAWKSSVIFSMSMSNCFDAGDKYLLREMWS